MKNYIGQPQRGSNQLCHNIWQIHVLGQLLGLSKTCGFQNREIIRVVDTQVHIYCYKHGYETLSDYSVLL